jgi:general secretion pathway protein M
MKTPQGNALQARWAALAPREQTLVLLAAGVVALALAWALLLAPALRTWRQSAAQHSALDAQWSRMQALQAQAEQLKQAARLPQDGAAEQPLRALQSSTSRTLGAAAKLTPLGAQVTVTLHNAPAQALAQWLAQVRTTARAVVQQAQLEHAGAGADGAPRWNGTLVLTLPAD